MLPVRAVAPALALAVLACAEPSAEREPFEAPAGNAVCTECHNVPDLWVRDPVTKERMLVTIDPEIYARSDHGGTLCVACHADGYKGELPHEGPNTYPRFLCVDCHEELGDAAHLRLPTRKKDLLAGAHGDTPTQAFDCHDCHDPHVFRLVRAEEQALQRIDRSNQLCLPCHEEMDEPHKRFPNPDAHFRKVKCLGCHVPKGSRTGHDITSAAESIGECSACHSPDGSLAVTSYTILGSDDIAGGKKEAQGNVYIVGASSSVLLDLLSFAGFAFILLLVTVHGVARLLHTKRRKGRTA